MQSVPIETVGLQCNNATYHWGAQPHKKKLCLCTRMCTIAALLCKTSKADAFVSKNVITLTQTQRHLTAPKWGLFTNHNS